MKFDERLTECLAEMLEMQVDSLLPKVKESLRKTLESMVQEPIIDGWVNAVAKVYSLDPLQVYAETRRQPIAEARQVSMYLAAIEGKVQHKVIASHFGCVKQNVDYTVQKINGAVSVDKGLRRSIETAKIIYDEANSTDKENTDEAQGVTAKENPNQEGICKA